MNFVDLPLSTWAPNPNSYLYRPGPRPPFDRDVNYEERFDYTTIIYDAFWSEDGAEILMICPPPDILTSRVFDGDLHELPSGKKCEIKIVKSGPVHILHVPVSKTTRSLRLTFALGTYDIVPQPNYCAEFAGERILISHNKNNALHWIRDWAHFHVEMHGCTAVFFYDNGSDHYSKYDVRAALATIPGLKHAVVVDAAFPFGAVNGPMRKNDSRYFQSAYLAHAKYRLYNRAAGILHTDIDELVISPTRESVFDAVENSSTGCLTIAGEWVERATETGIEPPIQELRHAAFNYIASGGGRRTSSKTALAPSRNAPSVYLLTHSALGVQPDPEVSARFKLRHFLGLKTTETNVKNKDRLNIKPFDRVDPAKHEIDPILTSQLKGVFESDKYRQMPTVEPFAHANDGETCRRFAGRRFAKGDYEGALRWIKRAVELSPDYPSYHQYMALCYETLRHPEEAQAAAKRAQELWSESPEYRVMQIKKMRQAGKHDAIPSSVIALVEHFPESADGQAQYGELLARQGDREGAESAFRKAVEFAPKDPRKMLRLARHLQRTNRDEAIDLYRRALALPEVDVLMRVKGYRALIAVLERAQRLDEAAATVQEAITVMGPFGKVSLETRQELQDMAKRLADKLDGSPDAQPVNRHAISGPRQTKTAVSLFLQLIATYRGQFRFTQRFRNPLLGWRSSSMPKSSPVSLMVTPKKLETPDRTISAKND